MGYMWTLPSQGCCIPQQEVGLTLWSRTPSPQAQWQELEVQLGCLYQGSRERLPLAWLGSGWGDGHRLWAHPGFTSELLGSPHPPRALKESKPNPTLPPLWQVSGSMRNLEATLGQGILENHQTGRGTKPGRVEGSTVCFSTPPGMEDDHLERSA